VAILANSRPELRESVTNGLIRRAVRDRRAPTLAPRLRRRLATPVTAVAIAKPRWAGAGRRRHRTPPSGGDSGDEEEGMLRMSFLEHLQELRSRIIKMLAGVLVSVAVSLTFCNQLWRIIAAPAVEALTKLGIKPATLKAITPMEQFNVIWFKLPFLCALFIASPWILYQVWAFISPGLYKQGAPLCRALHPLLRGPVHRGRRIRLFRGFPFRPHVPVRHRHREPSIR
jgi:hypothetical protein